MKRFVSKPTRDGWKKVPIEFTYGEEVMASIDGGIEHNGRRIAGYPGPSSRNALYRTFQIRGHTLYFHRMVFFAHCGFPTDKIKNSRVVFGPAKDGMIVNGFYTNRFKDLLLQSPTIDTTTIPIPEETIDIHPQYGQFKYGYWYPVQIWRKGKGLLKCEHYELCVCPDVEVSCLMRSSYRSEDKLLSYHMHGGYDPTVDITHNGENISFAVSHVILSTVFPDAIHNESVDHIDSDPLNHHINNLQWLSLSDNCSKGQAKAVIVRKENKEARVAAAIADPIGTARRHAVLMEGVWKPLPIDTKTRTLYRISDRGVFKNARGLRIGECERQGKYSVVSYATLTKSDNKGYVHRLVYMTFHGPIPDGVDVCHDDKAPLREDGAYRNWACDLRLGTRSENNVEHHVERRNKLSLLAGFVLDVDATVEDTDITSSDNVGMDARVDRVKRAAIGRFELANPGSTVCWKCECVFCDGGDTMFCGRCLAHEMDGTVPKPATKSHKESEYDDSYKIWEEQINSSNKPIRGVRSVVTLTREQFEDLVSRPCSYCGYYKQNEACKLDRIDHSKCHSVENSRSCCSLCYSAKGQRSVAHFIEKSMYLAMTHTNVYKGILPDMTVLARYPCATEIDTLYEKFAKGAVGRRHCVYEMTEEEYDVMRMTCPCYICAYSPHPETAFGRSREYNTLDRIDSTMPYSKDNCRACCTDCLAMKGATTLNQFIQHVAEIARCSFDIYNDIQEKRSKPHLLSNVTVRPHVVIKH